MAHPLQDALIYYGTTTFTWLTWRKGQRTRMHMHLQIRRARQRLELKRTLQGSTRFRWHRHQRRCVPLALGSLGLPTWMSVGVNRFASSKLLCLMGASIDFFLCVATLQAHLLPRYSNCRVRLHAHAKTGASDLRQKRQGSWACDELACAQN